LISDLITLQVLVALRMYLQPAGWGLPHPHLSMPMSLWPSGFLSFYTSPNQVEISESG